MTTAKRGRLYFLDIDPDQIDIEDIAHALARTCRYAGHTAQHMSVAQHSVFVSELVTTEAALHGLMHDAHEAYLGDPINPLKRSFPKLREAYNEAQDLFDAIIFEKFGVERFDDEVQMADLVSCATEARDLFGVEDPIEEWGLSAGPHRHRIRPWPYRRAIAEFLHRFHELTNGRFQ